MKKITTLGFLVLSIIILGACGNKGNENVSKSAETSKKEETQVTAEKVELSSSDESYDATFVDGILTTPDYKLAITKTQIGRDTPVNEDGLILWLTVTNNSDFNVKPSDLLTFLEFKQTDATSEYEISTTYNFFNEREGLFPMYDENGIALEDFDEYNAAIGKQNELSDNYGKKFTAELLPGKEVETVVGLTINNLEYPITVKMIEGLGKENIPYIINLK